MQSVRFIDSAAMASSSRDRAERQMFRVICFAIACACLPITGIAQTERSASAPPPYQSLRYEEDWTYLSDKTKRSDTFDSLKYIPLNSRGWFLSMGGEARIRYEFFSQFNFGAGPQDDNGYLLQRYLLHAETHFGKHSRFFFQLQSGIENGRSGGPRPTDEDRLDIHQAFADWKFGSEGRSITVRVGRHEMEFGSGRLISAGEGLNVRRSFDGVRLIYQDRKWLINGQADKLVSIKPGIFDDARDRAQTFWGVGATRSNSKIGGGHQFAYIGLDRKMARFDRGIGREVRHSFIARTYGGAKQVDYNFDAILQWGTFRGATKTDAIRAWAVASDTGYTLKEILFKPRIALRADATSGDQNPNGGHLGTFNPLFPGTSYSDTIGLLGPSNTLALDPYVRLAVNNRMSFTSGLAFFWRNSRRDGIYGINIAPLRTGQLSLARDIGSLYSARLDWRINRHWSYLLTYSYFNAGRFLKETPPGRDVNYVTSWAVFKF